MHRIIIILLLAVCLLACRASRQCSTATTVAPADTAGYVTYYIDGKPVKGKLTRKRAFDTSGINRVTAPLPQAK